MDFKTYQKKARETAQYPNLGSNNIYPTLGLVGEAGEVAEKVKKVIRDNNGIFDNESKLGIKKELGDVLWYISNLSTEFGVELDDVASDNLAKLKNRSDRNKIYPTLGLVGEAGEVAEKVKKVIRDKNGIFDNESKLGIKKELGDVLWYISNLCTELNFNLEDVALQNIEKLKSRAAKGRISGSGDDR